MTKNITIFDVKECEVLKSYKRSEVEQNIDGRVYTWVVKTAL